MSAELNYTHGNPQRPSVTTVCVEDVWDSVRWTHHILRDYYGAFKMPTYSQMSQH